MSRPGVPIQTAREVLGREVLGLEEITAAFGAIEGLAPAEAATVPFSAAELERGRANGELLILRPPACAGEPLTLLWLIRRCGEAFNPAFLRKVGYQLKDEWGIELEPLAGRETPRPGWALVRKAVLEPTLSLDYTEQGDALVRYAAERRARVRRRAAVETAFDLIAFHRARGERLLPATWDWSQSRTEDGGYLNVGHFDEQGLQVFSYSQAVRHGRLGVCPNLEPADED